LFRAERIMATPLSPAVQASPAAAGRLVLVPALITLAVTVLRLVGELQHWSESFFNRTMGGSLIGITWLPPFVGVYFALKLAQSGNAPKSYMRAIGYSVLGTLVLVICAFAPSKLGIEHGFYDRLIYGWSFFVLSALITLRGWPELFKALLAYGIAARVPVAIIMFFAFRGHWGTHYDAVPPDVPALGLAAKYLWLGFFPQLTLWVAFTILAGMLFGTLTAGIRRLVRIDRGMPV
jgi:hypothetical protein